MTTFPDTNSIRMLELLNAGTERNLVSMFAWNVLWPYPNTDPHSHRACRLNQYHRMGGGRGERVAVLWALLLGVLERCPCRYTLSRKHCVSPRKNMARTGGSYPEPMGKCRVVKKQLGRKIAAETIFSSHNFAIIITSLVGT